ncbi:MAG: SRPBCC domain-containing protein [Gemmatimonadota bacterium]|nr:SRPBCC domain-containing protein [Gemmatimonadota bacterium]MDE2983505.1 SRPBCC domain-containing protein [Gemmatimonadota bacterium]
MTSGTPDTRNIELSVEIDAPVGAVWEAIATGDGIARWFAPFASVEEGEGGTVTVAWVEGADWPNRITVWRPGERLRMVDPSDADAVARGTALAVDYRLERAGGTTRLRFVNSNLPATPDWDEHFHMMTNGWRFFLWNLKHAVERHPGVSRRVISARPWVSGSREEVWERLLGENGVGRRRGADAVADSTPAGTRGAGSLAVGDPFHFVLDGGEVLEGKVVLCDRPWAFAGSLRSLNDGVLHVEMEGSGERWKMGVWLSAYGVGEGRCDRVGAALASTIGKLFPGEG